ncbi:MAG: 3-hydroxyacyl-CoA dehydrogenase family protein, partial [Myxococcota bacterium]
MNMRKVVIIGAGTMGVGIAEVCARAGMDTTLCDVDDAAIERSKVRIDASMTKAVLKGKLSESDAQAAHARMRFETSTEAAEPEGANLIIEAVPERIDLKKQVLHEVSNLSPEALIASNTSSLSVTELAAACRNPGRVLGLHFFNPVPVMSLLEIVRADQSEDACIDAALAFAARIDKSPIVVRDMPGFATSRLGIALGMEAIRMLEQNIASAEAIDQA